MRTRVQRWTSLAVCSALCGGLSLVGVAATSSSAGASTAPLTVTPTSLDFGSVTLGDVVGPEAFQLTNTGNVEDTISTTLTSVSGPGANDYFALPDPDNCPSPDLQGDITLAPAGTCTLDTFFIPGALGARPATVNICRQFELGRHARPQRGRHHRLLPGEHQGHRRPFRRRRLLR